MEMDRRNFITVGAAALALSGRVLGANDRVGVAVCGTRGRGKDHIKGFDKVPGVELAALCDVDENVLSERLSDVEKLGRPRPRSYVDIRKLLEDKEIDAISIAAPNHWHSLMGIWACQAGKDVYVEKPCSHDPYEGRQLVRAVKKYNRICQHGSQSRSNPGMIEAIPSGVHYDLWTGPAPLKQFTRNRFHYNWHWNWDNGNGEIGNQAIHEIDIARWGLGVRFPTHVSAMGGHFIFDDDQETPNVLNATYYFDEPNGKRKMMELEIRPWITNHEAEIGTGFYKSKGIPAAGLSSAAPAAKPEPVKS